MYVGLNAAKGGSAAVASGAIGLAASIGAEMQIRQESQVKRKETQVKDQTLSAKNKPSAVLGRRIVIKPKTQAAEVLPLPPKLGPRPSAQQPRPPAQQSVSKENDSKSAKEQGAISQSMAQQESVPRKDKKAEWEKKQKKIRAELQVNYDEYDALELAQHIAASPDNVQLLQEVPWLRLRSDISFTGELLERLIDKYLKPPAKKLSKATVALIMTQAKEQLKQEVDLSIAKWREGKEKSEVKVNLMTAEWKVLRKTLEGKENVKEAEKKFNEEMNLLIYRYEDGQDLDLNNPPMFWFPYDAFDYGIKIIELWGRNSYRK